MAKFFSIGLEDEEVDSSDLEDESTEKPDELEKANHMVTNEESTDPVDVVKIANYKEELEKLKEGSGEESDSDYGDDTESSDGSDSSSDSDTDMDSSESGESDSEEVDNNEEDSSEEDSENEKESDPEEKKEEPKDPGEGLTDNDVTKLHDATESYRVVCKLNDLVRKGNERNNLSNVAVEMIDITLKRIKNRLNFVPLKKMQVPAFEDISGFTNRKKYAEKLQDALESIVGDIWNTIVKMITAIIDWIKDFIFNRKASVASARAELKNLDITNKKLVNALEKKEKLQEKKTKDGTVVTVKSFSSTRAHQLLAPVFDPTTLKSLEDSFILSDRVMKGQVNNLEKIYEGLAQSMDNVFDIKDDKDLLNVARNSFVAQYLDKKDMKETDTLPQVDLTGYSCLKTDVIVMNTGFYLKYIKYDTTSNGHDKEIVKGQSFGFYKGDDPNQGVKIPLISKKEQALLVKKWLDDINKTRETITNRTLVIKKDLENYMKSVDQLKGKGNALHADMASLLSLIIASITGVVQRGLTHIEKTYELYFKLLKAYHDESVKEYVN